MSTDRSAVGRKSKNKGANYERKVAKDLTEWWGAKFNRTPGSGGLHWEDMRVAGDIVPPIDSRFPFVIECKKREGWSMDNLFLGTGEISDWWGQVVGDSRRVNLVPLLIFTRNHAADYVMIPYNIETYMELRGSGMPVMRTTVTHKDKMTKVEESYDVLVLTLDGLTSYSTEYIIGMYTDWDWEEHTLLETNAKEVDEDDMADNLSGLLGKLKNI